MNKLRHCRTIVVNYKLYCVKTYRIYGLKGVVQRIGQPVLPISLLLFLFLWRYVDDYAYSANFSCVTQLKVRITCAFRSVRADVLQNVWRPLDKRLNGFVRQNGGHIQHL